MSINTLEEGGIYKVVKRFTDCRGTVYEPGYTSVFPTGPTMAATCSTVWARASISRKPRMPS